MSNETYVMSEGNVEMSSRVRADLDLPVYDPALADTLGAMPEVPMYLPAHPSYVDDIREVVDSMQQVGGEHVLVALGPPGSNSHIVGGDLRRAIKAIPSPVIKPDASWEPDRYVVEPMRLSRGVQLTERLPQVLATVLERPRMVAKVGILPIVNTVGGYVMMGERTRSLDAIRRSGARVLGVMDLPVEHCLLGRDRVVPEDLVGKKVHSHRQALAQCALQIAELGLIPEEAPSTSAAAAALASGELEADALAIAPRLAAKIHRLEVLAEDIGDKPQAENVTVMAVVAHPNYERLRREVRVPRNQPVHDRMRTDR